MRRKDREITDFAQIVEVIRKCDVCRIALNDKSGYPYVVPLNFGLEVKGRQVYLWFHCASRGTKLDLIERDNRATFEMDCGHELITYDEKMSCTMGYESVIGHGTIEVVSPEEKERGLRILLAQYHEEGFPINERLLLATKVLRLNVTDMTGKRNDNVHPDKRAGHGHMGGDAS